MKRLKRLERLKGIALLLNPTYKKQMLTESLLWEKEWIDSVMDHFMSSFDHYKRKLGRSSENSSSVPSYITTSVVQELSGFANYQNKKRRVSYSAASIVEKYTKYFNEPLAVNGTIVLQFWKENAFNYPILSAMAKDYLTVQASSVSAERAFSSGADLVTADRCSLTGKNIEMNK